MVVGRSRGSPPRNERIQTNEHLLETSIPKDMSTSNAGGCQILHRFPPPQPCHPPLPRLLKRHVHNGANSLNSSSRNTTLSSINNPPMFSCAMSRSKVRLDRKWLPNTAGQQHPLGRCDPRVSLVMNSHTESREGSTATAGDDCDNV
jgi:hypothetical protein